MATSRVRWSWWACVVCVVAVSAGCAEGVGVAEDSLGEGGAGAGGEGGSAGPEGCSSSQPCSPGSVCHNGACADGCNGDGDCAEGEFCAVQAGQICQARDLPSCPDEALCADTQVCVDGLCGVQTGTPCGPSPFGGGDGCPEDQMCLTQARVDGTVIDSRQCYALPACSPELTCPVGSNGALCSAGVMADKAALCIPGICLGTEHCPAGFGCVRASDADTFGRCTDGSSGSLCKTTADCQQGSCITPTAGLLGQCGGGS